MLSGAASHFRWEGKVERSEEAVVLMKTVEAALPRLLERAEELHPYDVPELLVQRVVDGAPAYLQWVREECRAGMAETAW